MTGLHTQVIATFQRGILATGFITPNTSEKHGFLQDHVYLEDIDGNTITIPVGSTKPTFINIWATWCPPCVAEMPNIDALYEEMSPQVEFIMISRDKDRNKAIEWVEKNGYDFPIYFLKYRLPETLQSQSIPTSFVIAPTGEIVMKHVGMSNYDTQEFRDFLKSI